MQIGISPGMLDLGEPMLDLMFVADLVEDVVERIFVAGVIGELRRDNQGETARQSG